MVLLVVAHAGGGDRGQSGSFRRATDGRSLRPGEAQRDPTMDMFGMDQVRAGVGMILAQ